MIGGWLLLTIALAAIFWLFEVIRARIKKRPPPWKLPREPEPRPPLARALWGEPWELPKVDPQQRRRNLWLVLSMYAGIAVVAGTAALVTHDLGGSNGAVIAAAIFAVVTVMVLALFVAAVVELRERR